MPGAYSLDDLFQRAQRALDDCHPGLAKKFMLKALAEAPNDVRILEELGSLTLELCQTGDGDSTIEEAREYYSRAIATQPSERFEKYLSLAQISAGKEAVDLYEKGGALMRVELQGLQAMLGEPATMEDDKTLEIQEVHFVSTIHVIIKGFSQLVHKLQMIVSYRRRMASLLCSMAEIYLTDCCQESDAEVRCEQFLSQALSLDPESIEALQTLASVRLSQSRPSDASDLILQSLGLWTALEPGTGLWPSFGIRMNLVRILLELSFFDEALSVLQINQTEDDEDPEVWYLFGWCYYIMAAKNIEGEGNSMDNILSEDIKELRMDAVECLETVLSLDQKHGTVSEPILAHTQELLESLRTT